MLVLSRLEYGNELYKAAAKTHLQKLDTIHNAGVRAGTSPTDNLLAEVCMPDLELRRGTKDLKIGGKALQSG
jgi:hypothetical protein